MVKRVNRWEIQALGLRDDRSKPKSRRWRSYDLRGTLPLKTTRTLEIAIQSLPGTVAWPEIDEEAWWRDVLSDARVRVPTRKLLPFDGWHSKFRLDRQQCSSITFACSYCRQRTNVSVAGLIVEFGGSRNVSTLGSDVLKCPNKRARREGYDCPAAQMKEAAN
jgi:hypothetical protein